VREKNWHIENIDNFSISEFPLKKKKAKQVPNAK
jgi:hypothetical protein